jgi:SET domain-containing protein
LYAGVDIKKDEFIGEYKGEIISSTELKRREVIDDRTYYLFDLSSDQTVDASTKGNKMRFINNSSKFDNCVGQNMLSDQQIRIGMYALKDIKAGEEFFFNYNWPTHVQEHLEFGDLDGEKKIAPPSRPRKGHPAKGKDDARGKPRMTAAAKKTREESVSSTTTTPSLNSRGNTDPFQCQRARKSSTHFQTSSTQGTQDQLDQSDSEDEDYEEYEESEASEAEFDEDEDVSMPDADE